LVSECFSLDGENNKNVSS